MKIAPAVWVGCSKASLQARSSTIKPAVSSVRLKMLANEVCSFTSSGFRLMDMLLWAGVPGCSLVMRAALVFG